MFQYKVVIDTMLKQNITKYRLSQYTGISAVMIGRYLRTKNRVDPSTENVKKISVALQIDIRELI